MADLGIVDTRANLKGKRKIRAEMLQDALLDKSPEQIELWLENNVTDIASARQTLKKLYLQNKAIIQILNKHGMV